MDCEELPLSLSASEDMHRGSSMAVVLGRRGGSGAEVVVVSSSEPRPLGDRSPADPRSDGQGLPLFGPELVAVAPVPLRPALGRVFPELLAAVDSHIGHPVADTHRLAPAAGGPIRLEHVIAVAQVRPSSRSCMDSARRGGRMTP